MVMRDLGRLGRPIYHNINRFDPTLAEPEWDHVQSYAGNLAHEWGDLPDGSIVILDEVQRQWGAHIKSPVGLMELDTHRHRGFDFVIISQDPMLLAAPLRRFIEHHFHGLRLNGMRYTKWHHWETCNERPPRPDGDDQADVERVPFDKKLFQLYQSASVHHDKVRVPWKTVAYGFALLGGLLGVMAFGLTQLTDVPVVAAILGKGQDIEEASAVVVDDVRIDLARCLPIATKLPLRVRVQNRLVLVRNDARLVRVGDDVLVCAPDRSSDDA